MTDLTKQNDTTVAKRATEATMQIAEAEAAATRAASEAASARALFEEDPTAESLAAREINTQRAKNAAAKLEQLRAELAPTIEEAARRQQRARLEQLRQQMDWPGSCRATGDRVQTIVREFQSAMRAELSAFTREMAVHNGLVAERETLERLHGDGSRWHPLDFERELQRVTEPLHALKDHATGQPPVRITGTTQAVTASIHTKLS